MSLQVKFPFGRGQGPLHTCRSCGFGTRHRLLFERHSKRCPAALQRTQQLSQSSAHQEMPPPPPLAAISSAAGSSGGQALPLPPVCRNYKCEKCTFTTNKSRIFLHHQREVHGENITIYVCDHCEYASRHKNKVYRHRKLVHKDAEPIDEIPSESDAALQQYVLNQEKPVDVEQNEPQEMTEEDLMRSSYTNLNGSPSMVNPRPTQVDDRYATYDYGDSDLSFNQSALDSSAYETVDEEILDDNGDPINQNPDPTENAYDYIVKSADFSIESPMFKCKLCYYSNPHKWKIANHIRTIHMKKTLFKCPYCDFVCERKIEWCVHKTSHTNKVVYSCQECQYKTTMKRNFDRHQARHRSGGPIKCSMCSYSSTGEAAIQRHMAEYHPSPPKDENKLPSPSPAKSWTGPAIGNTPVKLPPRYCRTPDQPDRMNSFSPVSTPSTTPRPSSQPSPMSSTSSSPTDVICPVCGLNVKTESKLKIHMVSHSSEAHWTCPLCPLRYKRAADLNRHMKRKHDIRLCDYRNGVVPTATIQEQPLDLCVKKIPSSDEEDFDQPLDLSMKTSPPTTSTQRPAVLKPENLKCTHCSYLAKWPSDLRRHMLVHSIEKRFRCQYCNKKYKYQFDLNMHLRKTHKIPAGRTRIGTIGTVYLASNAPPKSAVNTDRGDGPTEFSQDAAAISQTVKTSSAKEDKTRSEDLKCKYCKYVGKYRAEVERHMRLHTGKKPYHCMFCVYKSFWKGDMKRHLQKHHSEEIDQSGRDIKVLVNDTFRPTDDPNDEPAESTSSQGDLMDYASLIEPEDDKTESFAEAYPSYPEFGQTVFPGMEPNNNTSVTIEPKNPGEDYSQSTIPWTETNNNTPEKADPKKVCKCPRCPFVCEAPSKLKCHMEIHDNLKRFMCPQCGKRSNWLWDVRKHIRKDHPGAPMDVTEMSEDDARNTLEEYLSRNRSPSKTPSKERSLSPATSKTQGTGDTSESILNQMLTLGEQYIKQEPIDSVEEEAYQSSAMPVFPTPVVMPFSRSAEDMEDREENQPAPAKRVAVGRYRPFKCSKCGRRSNWRWDLNKHIRQAHGTAKIITLSDEEARATFHEECLAGTSQQNKVMKPPAIKVKPQPPPPPAGRFRPFKCSKCNRRSNWKWDMNKHIRQVHPDATLIELSEDEARATYYEVDMSHESSVPGAKMDPGQKLSPASKSNLTQDIHKLKRFKCSGCPYRSNFRSDIGRHIKRKHRRSSVHVEVLDMDEAAATLAEYKEVWAKKKFVPSPAKLSPKKAAILRAQRPDITYTTATPANVASFSGAQPGNLQPKILSNIGRIPSNPLGKHGTAALRAKVWRCSKCNFKDRNKKVVVKHFRTHSDGTAFMCRVCGECADYRSTLVRHVRTKHNREDLVNCILETAIQDSSIPIDEIPSYSHGANIAEIEKEDPMSSSPSVGYILKHYNCRLCDMNSGDREQVVGHVMELHPEEKEPEDAVEEVDKITPAPPEETYAISTTDVKPRVRSENTQKGLKCKHCPYRTNKQGLLKIHSTYHRPQPGNKYKCKYCPYYVCASRLLHQHQALHEKEHREQGLSFQEAYPGQLDEGPQVVDCIPRLALPTLASSKSTSRARHFCDKCPYVSINKNDFIYHKQFHRPRPSAILKCDHCPYWVNLKRLLTQHNKVHTTQYKIQYYPPEMLKDLDVTMNMSPAKSDVSSDDEDDAIHVANLKQQIITSKITSVPITPEKLRPSSPDLSSPGEKSDPILVVNRDGQILTGGAYKLHHKCKHCPYVNVRATNLRLHEKMHAANGGKGSFKCSFCDYQVGNKGLLSHHLKVHSKQYKPGEDDINDVEDETPAHVEVKTEEDMEVDGNEEETEKKPEFKFPERLPVQSDPSLRVDAAKLPQNMEYYVKFNETTGEHILEKATLKKWCCEKCPYATMKRSQFEKHVLLHGSNQKYCCEYCDYSVPGYHLLLQHKKLHLMPNPNLLSVQSISNLQKLPEVPADVAAASNYPNTTSDHGGKSSSSAKHGIHDQMDMYENSSDFSEPKKLYRCDRCPYTNIRRDHLLSHLKFHMINSDMKCPYCDYSVTKIHLLNQHIKVHFNTPGGEMNALPAKERKEKREKSPSAAAGSPPTESGARQPEFIDIADLGKTLKEDKEEGTEMMDTDASDAQKTENLNVKKAEDSSGSDTETYEPVEEDQPTAGSSDEPSADKENSGVVAKRKIAAEKDADAKKQETENVSENRTSSTPAAPLVCQYCDRSFSAQEKLTRHERQHLVGSKF